jgi:N-acylneuraminate cytidylyltransferase
MSDTKVLAIIPAKTDSTRLKKKNLRIIDGKTLVEHSIDYALSSELVKDIIVTTESDEVIGIVNKYDKSDKTISIYDRDESYMGEREVADVYINVFQKYNSYNNSDITHIVGIQPDHPDRTNNLDDMIRYFIDNKYDDLVTVDRFGTRNGSIRIVKAEYVESGAMSRRVGSMLDDCTNIHSEEDLDKAEKNILKGRSYS